MKSDIYYLLNRIETDLGDYDIKKAQEVEIQEDIDRIIGKLHEDNAHTMKYREMHGLREGFFRKNHKKRFLSKAVKAAVIFAAALLSIGGVAYAATGGEVLNELFTFLSGGGIYEKTISNPSGEESTASVIMGNAIETGNEESGVPLALEDGRLYFTGDGSRIDITDEISEAEPYYIDMIDETGNTHKFAIGGRAETGYYGYEEMIIDKEGKFRGGTGSFGENVSKDGTAPEWLRKAQEEIIGHSFE